MIKEIEDVIAFQAKFNVPMATTPSFLPDAAFEFRYKFMIEELAEMYAGHANQDMHEIADALVDLAYVLYGTAAMMGLPWDALWAEVQKKNMQKIRAPSAAHSKRKSSLDIIKPVGWTPPDHTDALGTGPWPTLEV